MVTLKEHNRSRFILLASKHKARGTFMAKQLPENSKTHNLKQSPIKVQCGLLGSFFTQKQSYFHQKLLTIRLKNSSVSSPIC